MTDDADRSSQQRAHGVSLANQPPMRNPPAPAPAPAADGDPIEVLRQQTEQMFQRAMRAYVRAHEALASAERYQARAHRAEKERDALRETIDRMERTTLIDARQISALLALVRDCRSSVREPGLVQRIDAALGGEETGNG